MPVTLPIDPFSQKRFRIGLLIAGAMLFAYVCVRAWAIPFVHDEAITFFYYIRSGVIHPYEAHLDANNHLLNSYLSRLFYLWGGNGEFLLRMPNVLSFGLYLFANYRIGSYLGGRTGVLFILTTWFSHILLDYFGFCRGYGLSFAFIAGACWTLLEFERRPRLWCFVLSCVFIGAAIAANLNVLPAAVAMTGWLVYLVLKEARYADWKNKVVNLAFILPLVWWIKYLVDYGFHLRENGNLYYGYQNGIWEDIILTVTDGALPWSAEFLGILALLFSAWMIVAHIVHVKNSGAVAINHPGILWTGLLVGTILAPWIMHEWKGVNYPTDRTILHWWYFFIGGVFFIPQSGSFVLDRLRPLPAVLISMLTLVIFLSSLNFTHGYFWKEERLDKDLHHRLVEDAEETGIDKPIVSTYLTYHASWIYQSRLNETDIHAHYHDYPAENADYIIARNYQLDTFPETLTSQYEELLWDDIEQAVLLKRKQPVQRIPIKDTIIRKYEPTHDTYTVFLELPVHEFRGSALAIEVDGNLRTESAGEIIQLVVAVTDEAEALLEYDHIPLNWLFGQLKHGYAFETVLYVPQLRENASRLKCYLWNEDEMPIEIREFKLVLNKLK